MMLRLVFLLLLPLAARPSSLPTVYKAGSGLDGVYTVYPAGPTSPVQVYCDMSKDDSSAEKWTALQRGQDGPVNFYRKWDHYKAGFGSAAGPYLLEPLVVRVTASTGHYSIKQPGDNAPADQVQELLAEGRHGRESLLSVKMKKSSSLLHHILISLQQTDKIRISSKFCDPVDECL
uniref:Fibrinogen C-terminal domain-containing protein n=1 Tax=Amphiprion percula TaxID=161767 RepID=A0A3P8S8H1_AMPPE